MTTAAPSTVLATIQPAFTDAERVALAGFLAGYRGLTREAYALVVTIPLAPRTARAIDLAIGERTDGPVFLAADGRRLDRHGAGRIVRKVARRAGIGKAVTPHTLRQAFITSLVAGVPLRDVQEAASHADPRITMRYAREGPRQPGPARDLHRCRLRRGRRPVAAYPPGRPAW